LRQHYKKQNNYEKNDVYKKGVLHKRKLSGTITGAIAFGLRDYIIKHIALKVIPDQTQIHFTLFLKILPDSFTFTINQTIASTPSNKLI
jgi:hypothetical protein